MTDTEAKAAEMAPDTDARVEEHEQHFSFSQFSSYQWCPKQYKFAYIDQVEPDHVPLVMLQGTAIHRAMELYNQGRMAGKIPGLDELLNVFDDVWEADTARVRLPRDVTLAEARKHGHAMIRALCEKPHDAGPVVAVEMEFEFSPLPDLPPVIGRIDLVERDDKGRLIITDYKTVKTLGRRPTDQLVLYRMALAAMGYEGAEKAKIREIQVTRSQEPDVAEYYYRPRKDAPERVMGKIVKTWKSIQVGRFPRTTVSAKCASCRFFDNCNGYAPQEDTEFIAQTLRGRPVGDVLARLIGLEHRDGRGSEVSSM